jgi:hypothetical protein
MDPNTLSDPAAAAAGAAAPSPNSSTGSPAARSDVADPGPAFDPAAAVEPARDSSPTGRPGGRAPLADSSWREAQVRQLLVAQGHLTHGLVAVGPKVGVETAEWQYLDEDLDAIAPGLVRMMNKIPAVKAAAAAGDPIAVGLGFLGYGARSIAERQAALAIASGEDVPAPGPAHDRSTHGWDGGPDEAAPHVDLSGASHADAADLDPARDIPPLAPRRA